MNRDKDEYNSSTSNFTRCYAGYQQYGVSGPCKCLQILNPTPATVMPDILRGVKPHGMPVPDHNSIECDGCYKNRYATSNYKLNCYTVEKSSQCTNPDNL